jgi:RNA polymerase sigma factor (sigma-70 family)
MSQPLLLRRNLGLTDNSYSTLREHREQPESRPFRTVYNPMYMDNFGWVERVFIKRGVEKEQAIDLAQESFIAFNKPLLFGEKPLNLNNLASYLYTTAVNKMTRFFSTRKPTIALTDGVKAIPCPIPTEIDVLISKEISKEILSLFDTALTTTKGVSPRDIQVLKLIYLEEMKHPEIAKLMNITEGISKEIKYRAGKKVLETLKTLM